MTAISPQIQAVLEVFEGPLAQVRFADVDAATLRGVASEVEAAAAEIEAQQAALEALRKAQADRQEQLLALAQRALAYAKVYAENDDALSARLAAIHLPRAPKRQKAEGGAEANGRSAAPADGGKAAKGRSSAVEASASEDGSTPTNEDTAAAESSTNAGSRRGKRREATRVVALEDA